MKVCEGAYQAPPPFPPQSHPHIPLHRRGPAEAESQVAPQGYLLLAPLLCNEGCRGVHEEDQISETLFFVLIGKTFPLPSPFEVCKFLFGLGKTLRDSRAKRRQCTSDSYVINRGIA